MKTARFSDVVTRCGRPTVYVSWLPPDKDPVLRHALKENRVLTVHQELHGGKKDYGTVGLFQDRHVQLLVFPKSLRHWGDRRIVAIDYGLLTQGPALTGHAPPVPARKKPAPPPASLPVAAPPPSAAAVPPKQPPRRLGSAKMPAGAPASASPKLVAELRRVRDELATGKAVPAFQRLERLLASLDS